LGRVGVLLRPPLQSGTQRKAQKRNSTVTVIPLQKYLVWLHKLLIGYRAARF
jgi:hypothetical protein